MDKTDRINAKIENQQKLVYDLSKFHEHFGILYALILKSDNETFEQIFRFLYLKPEKIKQFLKQNGYFLLLMCVQYHSKIDDLSTPSEYITLENLLKVSNAIASHFEFFNPKNTENYINYVNTLIKTSLLTKKFLYWEHESENVINVYYYKQYYLYDIFHKKAKLVPSRCTIKKFGRTFHLFIGNYDIEIAKIREIEKEPSLSRFKSIYEAIANTIKLSETDYCPYCNPKSKPKRPRGCKDCTRIKNFFIKHAPMAESSFRNELQAVKEGALLNLIKRKGYILKEHLKDISDRCMKSNDIDLKNEIKEIETLIDEKYHLK